MKKYQIQPDYFKDFQCIASRCSDSCCIGWEIDIDKETMDYYNSVEGEFGSRLKSCIEKGSPEEEPHFRLKGERCPFLNQKNLCDIYIELGKEHLCEICSEHPRFYQWFPGSTETGLGLCCEAAGRLILDKKEPVSFETVCLEEEGEPEEEITGILRKARDAAVKVLQDRKRNIYERLLVFIQMTEELQDGLEFSSPAAFDGAHDAKRSQKGEYGAWLLKWYRQMISFLETLEPIDEGWQDYLKGLKGKLSEIAEKREDFRNAFADKMYEWEQLAVYFVYRYFLKGACEGDALSRGGAAVFSVLIIEVMGIYHWLSEGSFQIKDQIENAKNYSKEVEYCIENMEALYDRFWEDEAFSMEALALAVKNPALKKCEKSLEFVTHTFEPVFDQYSRVLVLGSMPSPKSREQGFYYGHPRNRFWPVLAKILGEKEPVTIEEKRQMALKNHIAVWDVLESCEIHGADDGSIKNPVANDMNRVLKQAPIRAVFTTGTKAGALYKRFCQEKTGLKAISLPSTSPANCRMGMEELEVEYRKILAFLAEK